MKNCWLPIVTNEPSGRPLKVPLIEPAAVMMTYDWPGLAVNPFWRDKLKLEPARLTDPVLLNKDAAVLPRIGLKLVPMPKLTSEVLSVPGVPEVPGLSVPWLMLSALVRVPVPLKMLPKLSTWPVPLTVAVLDRIVVYPPAPTIDRSKPLF